MKKIAIILMAIITLSSCESRKIHTKALKGRIVFKRVVQDGRFFIELNDKDTFKWVRVHKVHFEQYKVGDTIK